MPPKKRSKKAATAATATTAAASASASSAAAAASGGRRPTRRAAAASSTRTSKESSTGSDISELALADLLRHLQSASATKARCTAALQALIDGHCPRPSSSSAMDIEAAAKAVVEAVEAKEKSSSAGTAASSSTSTSASDEQEEDIDAAEQASQDASLVPLTTHVLQRLLAQLRVHASAAAAAAAEASTSTSTKGAGKKKKAKSTSSSAAAAASSNVNEEEVGEEANQVQVQVAVVATALSYSLTQLLLTDRPRLEKCAHHTTPPASASASASSKGSSAEDTTGSDARSIVGRAIVAASLSSLAGLEVLVKYGLVGLAGPEEEEEEEEDEDAGQTQNRSTHIALLRSSAWSALRTMERLTHINLNPPSAVSPSGSGIQHSQVGYASPSAHYHASVASTNTVNAWREVLKELCRGTELRLAIVGGEPSDEGNVDDDGADDKMEVDEEVISNGSNGTASLVDKACGIASGATSANFPGEMEVLYAALNRVSIDPSAAVAAAPSESKSKSSSKRPTRKAGKKRGASTQSSGGGTSSAAATSLLSTLHHSHTIVFDGRIAIRRWTPMSLAWFGVGQKTVLDLATAMLRSEVDDDESDGNESGSATSWSTVLAPLGPGLLECSDNDGAASAKSNKRKRRSMSSNRIGEDDGSDGDSPPRKVSKSATGGKKRAAVSPAKTKKGTGGGRKSSANADGDRLEDGEDSSKVTVPGNVALVAFASRLVDLANEIGLTCGAKAPTGGMEAYARGILEVTSGNGQSSKGGSSRPKQKKKKGSKKASSSASTITSKVIRLPGGGPSEDESWARPDIRHEAAALTRWILSAHSQSLRENFDEEALLSTGKHSHPEKGVSDSRGQYLVNDDVLSASKQLRETALCFPFMPRTLDSLARCAASTIPLSSTSSSHGSSNIPRDSVSTCIGKMMALASALAIGGGSIISSEEDEDAKVDGEGHFVIADARLSSMAVCTLMDCVKRIVTAPNTSGGTSSSTTSSGSIPADLVQQYHLDQPLTPSLEEDVVESAKVDDFCSYGGTFILLSPAGISSSASTGGDDELGVLLGMASSATGQRAGGSLDDADVLALFLRAMLAPSDDYQYSVEDCTSRLLTQILRIVGCCYTRVPDAVPCAQESNVEAMDKMAFAKSALATDALEAFRKALLIRLTSSSSGSSKDRLRCCLRSCGLQSDHIRYLIDCSFFLESFFHDRVYSARQANKEKSEEDKTNEGNDNSGAADEVFDVSTRHGKAENQYDQAERRLWQSHIKCCLTVGRGKPGDLYVASNLGFSSKPILGDCKTRLSVYQSVVDSFGQSSDLKLSWPLALPSTLHALVTSNLSVEPVPKTVKDAAPERRICDRFVEAISEALQDLALVSKRAADFYVPLSLDDSRMFLLALLRIPKKEQTKVMAKLADNIYDGVVQGSLDFTAFKSAEERAAASGFLARLITTAVAAVDSIRAGRHLLETLRMQTGSEHYHIPAGLYDDFTHKEDWYGRSKSFLSLYGDWEQSGVPVPDVIDGTEPLVKASINKLITSFMVLFDKSFLSAKDDHCHLLFSAWNALAECSVWDLKAPMSLESLASGDTAQHARSLIEMRQDMCAIYKRIIGPSESHPDTMLFRGLAKKADTSKFRAMTVSTMLKTAVQFAVDITDKAVATLMKDDPPSSSSSSAALCAYEGVAAYISFLMAMHTKPEKTVNSYFGDDKLQKAGRRKGSGMSDSIEDAGSSDESDYDEDEEDEAKMVVLSKLNEACQAIGAAPVHPDWLDHSVRIRPGISPSEAAEAAKTALASLSKLANAARIHQEKALRQSLALSSTNKRPDGKDAQIDAALALRIQRSFQDEDSSRSSAIAETLGMDSALLSSLNDLSCSSFNDATVRETWCTNSAQQIRGGFQECAATLEGWSTTSAELRATNEWEMLLGDSLVTACTNIAVSQPDVLANWKGDSDALGASVDYAERWQNIVRSCVEAMVPCAALLRQGLNCGRGRSPHPLSVRDQASKLKSREPNVLRPSSPLPDSNIVSFVSVPQDGIKSALATSIAVLSDVASETGKTHALTKKACHVALCHLLGDSSQQKKVEDLATIRINLSALYAFDRALSSIGGAGDERVPIRPDEIVIGIVDALDREEIISQLLSALGIDNAFKVDMLSERQVNPTELLRDAQKQLTTLSPVSSSSGADDSLLPWTWGEKQEKPIDLLMGLLFKKNHNLTSATRSSIARLLSNLLIAEADHLLSTTSAGGNKATILPIIAKAWNQLDKKEVEHVVRDDICCAQNEEDSGCISLSKNVCTLLTLLCCSDTSTNAVAGADSYLIAAQIMASSIKDWAVVPDDLPPEKVSILEHQMELLCTLSTRSYSGNNDQLLKKTGEELLTLVVGERPGLHTKRGKAEDGPVSADARYLHALEFFFYFVHALEKRTNQMDVDIDTPIAESQKQQKGPRKGASSASDPERPGSGADDEKSEFFTTKAGTKVRRTCTFIDTGGDFKEQHWYNCYTCGLLWDKGCCTLCALTCHRDHDVGYFRKSSFFCDCGAEVASAGEENRVACQCLSPLSSKELATIYEEPESAATKSEDQLAYSDKQIESSSPSVAPTEAVNHIASHSHERAKRTINALVRSHPDRVEAATKSVMNEVKSSWGECLVEVFDGCFQAWSKKVQNPDTLSGDLDSSLSSSALVRSGNNDSACAANATIDTGASDHFPDISSRSGVALSLSKIHGNTMIPVRAAKANSVTVKLSSEPSTDRIKKALLSKNSIKRSALVSDSRGRVVVAEPNCLFFCSALPLVNVRYPAGSAPSSRPPVDRNQLCCLGSHKVDFSIVGMQFCPENDRHLVIWGTAEASIIVLSKNCDKVEKKIDLAIELEPHECDSEYLLKCDWLPSSETHVAVFCGTFVKVFDARRSTTSSAPASAPASGNIRTTAAAAPDPCKQYTCSSTTCYTLAYEDALIRSAAVVPLEKAASSSSSEEDKAVHDASSCAKIFLLFDSGRIHGIDIAFDSNNDLDDQGEIYIEAIGGLSFPTAGVRRYGGAAPGSSDSKSTSFGEGSSLVYLEQSGLLLYKCISSCVVAFIIDRQSGDISGSFEFLPQVITSSMLGSGLDGYSISAPYAQWTELGTCEKDCVVRYRVACTGKSTRTNQPKLLLVEFNVDSVRVQELSWTGGSTLGLGLSLNTSFEGIAAFSAPVIRDASKSNSFYERAYLAALTSNGCILVYGEDLTVQGGEDPFRQNHTEVFNIASNHSGVATHISSSSIGDNNVGQPKFPLTIFETLENFSHSQELVLGGDGVGKDPDTVKKKLSIHNGDFFMSPSREGCTLTVALQQSKSLKPTSSSATENFRAIVAVRLLLGSTTTDYLPRQVSVIGRTIKLSQGVKRWYDLPLTNEEIMLGIRSGFVALSISSSFDSSNNPLVDALEVYALPVEDLPFAVPPAPSCKDIFPTTEGGPVAKESSHRDQNDSAPKPTCILERNGDEKAKLQLILLSTVRAAQIALGGSAFVDATSFIDRKFILRSIEATALETQSKDQSVRQSVMDLVQKFNDNVKGRDLLVDGGTLSGIRKVMATLLIHVERFCNEASTAQDTTTDDNAMEVDTDSETHKSANALSYLPNILATLNDCLSTALGIVRARPANYSKSLLLEKTEDKDGRVSEDEKQQTLALIAGKILTPALSLPGATVCSGFALASANVVELAIREIGTEWAPSVESPTFDLVAKFLECTDEDAVRMMTNRMVEMSQTDPEDNNADSSGNNGAGKSQPETDKPPIAYQCDGCETFPIQRVRYTLEGGHDIDLCQDCYDVGVQYARSSAPDVAAYINGKSFDLNTGESMTCTDLLSMKRVSVGDEVLEDVRMSEQASDNDEDADLQLALAMSMSMEASQKAKKSSETPAQKVIIDGNTDAGIGNESVDPNTFISPLFDGLLDLVTASISDGPKANAQHVDLLLDCLLQLVKSSDSEETQIHRGKKTADVLCGAIVPITKKLKPSDGDSNEEVVPMDDEEGTSEKMLSSYNLVLFVLSSLVNGRTTIAASREACSSEVLVATIVTTNAQDSAPGKAKGSTGHKDKTDPRFVCDTHGVPAVRRRCSRGVHKDRRFYVCGMERKSRCKYFRWADEATDERSQRNETAKDVVAKKSPAQNAIEPPSPALKAIQEHVWSLLTAANVKSDICDDQEQIVGNPLSMYTQMCKQVNDSFKRMQPSGSQIPDVSFSTTITSADASAFKLDSLVDKKSMQEDLCDGVNLSRAKLRRPKQADDGERTTVKDTSSDSSSGDACSVYASLDLLGSVASPTKHGNSGARGSWIPLLCEIIGTAQHSSVRGQAKRLLKRLCGGKSNYHRVRDHYIFSFQYKALLGHCVTVLEAALIARERARQCGQNWREDTLTWSNMSAGSLIGACDLVSEDAFPVKSMQNVNRAFDELIDLTKHRSNNWRHFCALSKLPQNGSQTEGGILAVLSETSPIVSLFWIASSLSKHCDKALRLIEIALTARPQPGTENAVSAGVMSTDGGTDFNTDTNDLSPGRRDLDTPEQTLFSGGHKGLKPDEVYAFVMQFVLRGRTAKVRSSAKRIGHALSHVLTRTESESMFAKFVTNSLREVQTFGESSVEFLEFLQALATCRHNPSPSSNISEIAQLAVSCLTRQLSSTIQVLRSDDAAVEVELKAGSGQYMKKNFDLSSCAHCHREQVAALRVKSATDLSDDSGQGPSASSSGQSTNRSNSDSRRHVAASSDSGSSSRNEVITSDWLEDQVRPYTKDSLESSTESSISAEFTSYVKLKCRMAISEVHLSASDPRGRFVKTVAVYFTPRHVGKVEDLKKDDYLPIWQHCGNLNLSRGATRASFKLNTPVIAANLKFEYAEFHEKANSGRSADGGLILHCPRCTRVVNNAHGVCGHCGEVAFQCRKCRHINYDKLDAFLCVECGYCAYASFNYDLTAGIASNAVAITNEEDYQRGVRLLRAAAKRQSDLRDHKLRKKLLVATPARKKRAREADFDDLGWLSSHSPHMKRAMLGELPRMSSSGKSDGSHHITDGTSRRKSSGHGASGAGAAGGSATDRSSAASRARSLLSLARQLRDEASGRIGSGGDDTDGERLSRGDMLVRQALLGGSAGSFEMGDDDADMLGLLGAASSEGGGLGFEDPLSRLVADIQGRVHEGDGTGDPLIGADDPGTGSSGSRRRGRGTSGGSDGGAGEGGGDDGNASSDAKSSGRNNSDPRETMEELDTLHQQMREAERECFELRTKLNAWTRLNCDRIADTGSRSRDLIFTPTTCGLCCSKVTLSMLLLVVSLLQHAEEAITPDFVRILFEDSLGGPDHDDLVRYQRWAIVKIALLSERGADMVLNELKLRLKASQDTNSAQILGSILSKDGVKGAGRFVELAEAVLSGQL